jgi:5-methylcytosine-specific restriction endonuclease McrA
MNMKRCSTCKQEVPFTPEYFHRSKAHPNGLYPICKKCVRAKKRKFDAENRELVNARERARQHAIRDELNVSRRERYAANPKPKRISDQRYYAKAKHKIQRRQLKWAHEKPEKKKAIGARYRARKHSLPHDFTGSDWQYALDYFNGCCAYCGNPPGLWNRLAVEHYIPVTDPGCPGTVPTNIVPACQSCNSSKHDALPDEWLERQFGKRQAAIIKAAIERYFKSLE